VLSGASLARLPFLLLPSLAVFGMEKLRSDWLLLFPLGNAGLLR
jgi:hypothetical protein